ncbi:MAG: hypothetical protein ACOVQ6_04270 [Brevundimonas sp.]
MITILDSEGPTTYHRSRAAAAVDIIHRLNGTGPQHLTGAAIVDALTCSSRIWILTTTGREIQADWAEVAR